MSLCVFTVFRGLFLYFCANFSVFTVYMCLGFVSLCPNFSVFLLGLRVFLGLFLCFCANFFVFVFTVYVFGGWVFMSKFLCDFTGFTCVLGCFFISVLICVWLLLLLVFFFSPLIVFGGVLFWFVFMYVLFVFFAFVSTIFTCFGGLPHFYFWLGVENEFLSLFSCWFLSFLEIVSAMFTCVFYDHYCVLMLCLRTCRLFSIYLQLLMISAIVKS